MATLNDTNPNITYTGLLTVGIAGSGSTALTAQSTSKYTQPFTTNGYIVVNVITPSNESSD